MPLYPFENKAFFRCDSALNEEVKTVLRSFGVRDRRREPPKLVTILLPA